MAAWQENSSFKTRLGKSLAGALLGLLASLAVARPAAWYWWASRTGTDRICAQSSPGAGWAQENTAFRDSHCSRRVTPF